MVIGRTNPFGGFGIQLFDKNPTCDCCFSKLNLEKSKVKKLIELLVTSDEEFKDVVITEVIINNSFIGQELNFGENNIDRWNVYGVDGDNELNSYVLTIHEAVKMILASYEDGEYTEYYLFPDIPKD